MFGTTPTAGTVAVDVKGDFTAFRQGLDKEGNAAGGQFGSSFGKSFGSKVATLGATYLGANFVKGAIGQASDLAESINVTGLAFGDAREDIDSFAKRSADSFGLAESEFRQLSAQMGNVMRGFGASGGTASDWTLALMRRATDMGSAWNASSQEVSEAIISAFTSSTEPIRKFGVVIDQAAIKQKAVEEGLIGANDELDNYSKMLATSMLIMEQTDNVAGDFKNTQDGVANSAKTVGAMWKDMQAQLGTGLLPVLSMGLKILRQLGPEGLKFVVIGGAMVLMFTKLVGAASAFGKALTLLAANPWILVAAAIVAAGILIWRNWDTIVDKLGAAWDFVQTAGNTLAAWFTTKWAEVTGFVTGLFDQLAQFFVDWWPLLLGIFTGGLGLIVGLVIQHWDQIWNKTTEVTGAIAGAFTSAWQTVESTTRDLGGKVLGFIVGIPTAIAGAFTTLANTISSPFKTAFAAIKTAWNTTVGGFGFSVPGWIPSIGGNSFRIPSMRTGAVVNVPTLAIVGDAGAGNREIVTPENLMRDTVLDALAARPAGGGLGDIYVEIHVDGNSFADPRQLERHATELVRVVKRELERDDKAQGRVGEGVFA